MDEKEIFGSGHAVKGDEAPEGFHVAPRSENLQFSGPTAEPPPVTAAAPTTAAAPATAAATPPGTDGKKKRGRPRKYGPDGKLTAVALSPMPISASIPLTGDFSGWKRGRGKPVEAIKKSYKFYDVESSGPGKKIIIIIPFEHYIFSL